MKCIIVIIIIINLIAICLSSISPLVSSTPNFNNETNDNYIYQVVTGNRKVAGTERRFLSFIQKYGKSYSTKEEYFHRLGVFGRNLVRAVENQALDPSAKHGVTPFMDLDAEEFETMFMGLRSGGGGGGGGGNGGGSGGGGGVKEGGKLDVTNLPKSFDWRDKGAVTDVKMQGKCGSCWAFSTTGAIEGANFIATGKLLSLSEQQLVDCDHKCDPKEKKECDSGCGGGLMTNAYEYLKESGGLEDEASYPYTGVNGECKFDSSKVAVKLVNFTTVPIEEDQIAAHLVHYGPLAVGLNAVFMQTYIGGVSCPLLCGKKGVNHGVLLVGYGEKGFSILRLGYKPYWIIKNSWGKQWGENGYYRLCRGQGVCGINTMVSAVVAQSPR